MRIEAVQTFLVADSLFVRVATDTGICGWGQTALWGFPDAAEVVLQSFRESLLGRNPLDRERLWYENFRAQPFRGSFLSGAIAAIDIALWDIAGQYFAVPCYRLMGGPVRDRIRLHLVMGSGWLERSASPASVASEARQAVDMGFTALKFDPFLDGPDGFQSTSWARCLLNAVRVVEAVREEVGWDVDLAFELHRKFSVAESAELYEALRKFHPYMIEDALPPDSIAAWGSLPRTAISGTGERLDTIWEFADLIRTGAVDILRPDVGEAGGITHVLKIASLAEAFGLRLLCHNYVGPLVTLATAHVYAATQCVSTMEYTLLDERSPRCDLLEHSAVREGGYLLLPDSPGLGYSQVFLDTQPPYRRWAPHPLPSTLDGGLYLR